MTRRQLVLSAVAALCLAFGPPARAEDALPAPADAPEAERAAALKRADELDRQVEALYGQGKLADATTSAREAVELRRRHMGDDDPRVADSLNSLAVLLKSQSGDAEPRALFERAIAILEKAHGPDHPDVAAVLGNLGALHRDHGRLAEGRPVLERAIAIWERTQGKDSVAVAHGLFGIGLLLSAHGNAAEARSHYERALAIYEKALGNDHVSVATALFQLASLHRSQHEDAAAEAKYRRALAVYERALGPEHPYVAAVFNDLGELSRSKGAYAEAQPHYERALAIFAKAVGPDHPSYAGTLNNLALLFQARGAYAEAASRLERALAIRRKSLGEEHPDVAVVHNNLGALLFERGDYTEARGHYERAIAIYTKTSGPDHPLVAVGLHNLADFLRAQGSLAEAVPLYERAIRVSEASLGAAHRQTAASLHALAVVVSDQGDLPRARSLQERAVSIYEQVLGTGHAEYGAALAGLARILEMQGASAQARPLSERALAIIEEALGADHIEVATNLHNLAVLRHREGAYAEARALFDRALAICEKALGEGHPSVAFILDRLAWLLADMHEGGEVTRLSLRALATDERRVRAHLSALGAAQRLALVRSVRYRLDNWLRRAVDVGRDGYAEMLRFRGVVARAEAAERALARRATPAQRATLASLQAATRLAARLANEMPATPDRASRAAWQERYAKAAAERERLTIELSSEVASARAVLERLDLTEADVRGALAADAALVDVLRVGDGYVAWVTRAAGATARVELGAADAIDAACEAFVTAITDDTGDAASREAVATSGAALRALVWARFEGRLGEGVKRVVICPDAALASVPFAALPGKGPNTVLGDEVALSHVFHPFDLVPRARMGPGVGALVVGGVDYGRAAGGTEEAPAPARPPVLASRDRAPRGGTFGPIPATKVEAEALRDRFGRDATTLLLGADATEARLREGVKGKRFVHVATHGFARTDLLTGLYDRKIKEAFLSAGAERQLSVGHDPMLLSGLALAGANPRDGAGGDDGILTALEASYLDLDGVDLVTLSACETAKGTAESGEGVLGLVSAFQMAGARGVLASLWKVDDAATQRLMEEVYERMLRKENPLPPADALREGARALRAFTDASGRARYAAPRYWAAFVSYGG